MVSGAACVVCCVVHKVFFMCVSCCVLHVLFGVVYKVTLVNFFEYYYVVGISLSYRWFDGFLSCVLGNYRVNTGILPDYLQSGAAYGKVH